MLFLVDGVEADDLAGFARCLDLFDGNDPDAVEAARNRWRAAQARRPHPDLLAADRGGLGEEGVRPCGRRLHAAGRRRYNPRHPVPDPRS